MSNESDDADLQWMRHAIDVDEVKERWNPTQWLDVF